MRPSELAPCDLVMKGGVTSGIVYPGAVAELATRYRFANLGGTSAGAVAAAMAAACEYARQGSDRVELESILDIAQDGRRPGFFLELFQPTAAAQPLLSLLSALAAARGSHRRQVLALAGAAVRRRPVQATATLAAAAVLLALGALAVSRLPIVLALVLALVAALVVLLLAAGAVLGPLVALARAAWRSLPAAGFGVCSGLAAPGAPGALTDWLHASLQRCAGLPAEQPLTFAMLQSRGIALRMVATDLGLSRPVTMPFAEEQYLFSPAELAALFPAPVVDHVLAAAGVGPDERDSTRTWFLPGAELPVVVGARLSSSVPVLLSSLRLYSAAADADGPIESYMTDGGLTSNFPIHFFDDWLPSHPTFGLDLVSVPEVGDEPVFMPAGEEVGHRLAPRPVTGLGAFVGRVQDAARSWRDEAQAELPGYRDRVCQIRMGPGEGGFHLDADPAQVGMLMDRGREAGREILRSFDWERHRATRYLTLMTLLRENFGLLAERLTPGPPAGPGAPAAEWAAAVDAAVAELARHAGQPGGATTPSQRRHDADRAAALTRLAQAQTAPAVAQVRTHVGGDPPGQHGHVGGAEAGGGVPSRSGPPVAVAARADVVKRGRAAPRRGQRVQDRIDVGQPAHAVGRRVLADEGHRAGPEGCRGARAPHLLRATGVDRPAGALVRGGRDVGEATVATAGGHAGTGLPGRPRGVARDAAASAQPAERLGPGRLPAVGQGGRQRETRSPDRDRVRAGCGPVDTETVIGRIVGLAVIGPLVPAGDEERHPGRDPGPELARIGQSLGRGHPELARAPARADDRRPAVVDDPPQQIGVLPALQGSLVDDDPGGGRDRPHQLDVEGRLGARAVAAPLDGDDGRRRAGEAEAALKGGQIRRVIAGEGDDGHRLTLPLEAGGVQRGDVVRGHRRGRADAAQRDIGGPPQRPRVQSGDAGDHGRRPRRRPHVPGGQAQAVTGRVGVAHEPDSEQPLQGHRGAAHAQARPRRVRAGRRDPAGPQSRAQGAQRCGGEPEATARLRRVKDTAKAGGARILHGRDPRVEPAGSGLTQQQRGHQPALRGDRSEPAQRPGMAPARGGRVPGPARQPGQGRRRTRAQRQQEGNRR